MIEGNPKFISIQLNKVGCSFKRYLQRHRHLTMITFTSGIFLSTFYECAFESQKLGAKKCTVKRQNSGVYPFRLTKIFACKCSFSHKTLNRRVIDRHAHFIKPYIISLALLVMSSKFGKGKIQLCGATSVLKIIED